MADITACRDKRCPSRTLCYRYTCEKDTYQSYFAKSPRKIHAMKCNEYWESEIGICKCDAFALPHKKNKLCSVYKITAVNRKRKYKKNNHKYI
jgi:hypothetical protein